MLFTVSVTTKTVKPLRDKIKCHKHYTKRLISVMLCDAFENKIIFFEQFGVLPLVLSTLAKMTNATLKAVTSK